MTGSDFSEVLVRDMWNVVPEELRDEVIARRMAAADWQALGAQDTQSERWEPLRPVVIEESAYRHLESITARLLRLAVEVCQRRASTLGELHRALRLSRELPLVDPDAPLLAENLTRYCRPDFLIERGRPQLLEFNVATRLGGAQVTPQLAQAFVTLCPETGWYAPPSTMTAHSEAMIRTLERAGRPDTTRRLLVPTYWTEDRCGVRQYNDSDKELLLAEAGRAGFEVVYADLSTVRLDAADRLLADDAPVDLVFIPWGGGTIEKMVEVGDGIAALETALRAGTVEFFPHPESKLLSSKAVLAWLHEDCDAGVLAPTDQDLVRGHVPWTTALGLAQEPLEPDSVPARVVAEQDRLVVKPAVGKSGKRVWFGSQMSEPAWLADIVTAAQNKPVVIQRRVRADEVTMPFVDQDSGKQVTAQLPAVFSPFMIDGAAADVGVRHLAPGASGADEVISVSRGARSNAVVLIDAR